MSAVVISKDGDMVDALVAVHYGTTANLGLLDTVFAANPGLEFQGPVLPSGVAITMPDAEVENTRGTVRLWGTS
ncbi:MAG: tail protein X [Pseudomonadota bacterium]